MKISSPAAVRLGLVGLGWGERVVAASPELTAEKFVACFARTPGTCESFARRHGLRACASFEQMLAAGDLDGVVIMTPNSTHAPLAIAALAAGKHVLVTKPVATTLQDAHAMALAARKANRVLAVGHQSRRHLALRRMRELVAQGTLGEIRSIEGNTSSSTGARLATTDWRTQATECPGGPLLQLGIHYIDNYQYVLDEPITAVSAKFSKTADSMLPVTDVRVEVEFSSGKRGSLESSYVKDHTRWLKISGDAGRMELSTDGGLMLRETGGESFVVLRPTEDRERVLRGMLAEEVREFAHCIRTKTAPETGVEVGARNLAVVLAAVESAALGGQTVSVAERLRSAGFIA